MKKKSHKDNLDNRDNSAKRGPATSGQIIELEKQIEDLKAGWQRTQADFENFRKRTENEKLENFAFAKAEFMLKIAPVLDNFERAFQNIPESQKKSDWVQGIEQIAKQLEDILRSEGVERIPAAPGTKFDPKFHEAISCEPSSIAEDHIIDSTESGWQFNGRVLKPSKVRVSRGK